MKKYLLALIISISMPSSIATATPDSEKSIASDIQSSEAHNTSRRNFENLSRSTVQVRTQFGFGTGTLFKSKGESYVITAAHVIRGLMGEVIDANVTFEDQTVETSLAYVSETSDVAILKVGDIEGRSHYSLKFRRSSVSPGDKTAYCGYPNRPDLACFEGAVSQILDNYINIHSYAFGGASGALVVDSRGRVVGILTAIEVGGWITGPQPLEDVVWVTPIDGEILENL